MTPLSACQTSISTCTQDSETFEINFPGLSTQPPRSPVSLTSLGDCVFSVNLTTTGNFPFEITFKGNTVESNTFAITAGAFSPSLSTINEADLVNLNVGAEACFGVTVSDAYGNQIPNLLISNFAFDWRSAPLTTVSGVRLASSTGGVYSLCFSPNLAAEQQLGVRIQNKDISNSPVNITITAGAFDPAHAVPVDYTTCSSTPALLCVSPATELGLTTAKAGAVSKFSILSRDVLGNQKLSSTEVDVSKFLVVLERVGGNETVTATVTAGDGRFFAVSYTATVKGSYLVKLSYDGVALNAGVLPDVIVTAGTVAINSSPLDPSTAISVIAGSTVVAKVTAYDSLGNLADSDPNWTAALVGSVNIACPISELAPAQYTANCRANITGQFDLTFSYTGIVKVAKRAVTVTPGTILFSFCAAFTDGNSFFSCRFGCSVDVWPDRHDHYCRRECVVWYRVL